MKKTMLFVALLGMSLSTFATPRYDRHHRHHREHHRHHRHHEHRMGMVAPYPGADMNVC